MPQVPAVRRWILVVFVGSGNLIFWLIPSNVPALVAKEQQVLCGRYSRVQFAWMLGVAVVSVIVVFLGTATASAGLRRRLFALTSVALGLIPIAILGDLVLRLRTDYPYQPDPVVDHRPPGRVYRQTYRDEPVARRSYPIVQQGYGSVECTLTYDAAGFRNKDVPSFCDIVAIGDSFTEGSRVSDDQSWPARLANLSGKRVYNLGISGYNPAEYLAALTTYGLARKPRCVICMLYEGNDFHTGEVMAKSGVSPRQFFRSSPLLLAANDGLIRLFGSIGADWHTKGLDDLSWMPIAYPAGQSPRYYAFPPKQLTELDVTPRDFAVSEEWFAVKADLRKMQDACQAAGAKFIIAYAPNKAHVIFPLAASSLSAEKVQAFTAMQVRTFSRTDFMEDLCRDLESRETVIQAYCRERAIPFFSTTAALRKSATDRLQPYYTYDQHWSPAGHDAAARQIATALAEIGI